MRNRSFWWGCWALVLATGGATVGLAAGQKPNAARVFTAEQAAAGKATYEANCSGCHMYDLRGQNEAKPLTGPEFMNTWSARSTKDLYGFIKSTMPPGGSLAPEQYVGLAAFLLRENGAPAGPDALTDATDVVIGSIATGERPAAP
jgi:mono/diheme cytochrome c family protein